MGLARSNLLRRWFAAGLLISTFSVVQVTIGSAPAQARCAGVNQLVYSTLNAGLNGSAAVTEETTAGTCNGDYYYSATFTAGSAGGWRASVWIQNGGVWTGYFGTYSGGWYPFHYSHPAGSYSYMTLCRDDGGTWQCGWGNSFRTGVGFDGTYYGVNQGY